MKTASADNTSGVMRNKNVTAFYPVQYKEFNTLTTCSELSETIKTTPNVDAGLEPEHREVAALLATTYKYQRRLTCEDVLGGHGGLYAAHVFNGADYLSCAVLAALQARVVEQQALDGVCSESQKKCPGGAETPRGVAHHTGGDAHMRLYAVKPTEAKSLHPISKNEISGRH